MCAHNLTHRLVDVSLFSENALPDATESRGWRRGILGHPGGPDSHDDSFYERQKRRHGEGKACKDGGRDWREADKSGNTL